jgi:phospholipid/cholesterol/gamma-HCH transport system substrate-binding protein
METKANHVLIGAFALGTLLALAGFLLWLAKGSFERGARDYDIVFKESVTGLSRGGRVYVNGIEVGEVVSLKIDPEKLDSVRARVRIRADVPLRTDAEAKLAYQGLTGIAYILIAPGTQDAGPIQIKPDADVAEIPARSSDLAKLFEGSEDIMTGANDVFVRINRLLADDNLQRVGQTLAHLETLSGAVAGKSGDAAAIVSEARAIAEQLNRTLVKLESSSARIESLATSADAALNRDGVALMSELRKTSEAIRGLADNSNRIVVDNQAAVSAFTEHGLVEMGAAVGELRALLRTLNRIAQALESDPAGFVLSKSRPQEYRGQ